MSQTRKATIRDIADRAQVSTATVSHVFNNTRYVSSEVRDRVLRVSKELAYVPNSVARSLRSGKTRTIGLVLPDSGNPFFAEIGRHIEENAFAKGYSVIIGNTEGDPEKESFYLDTLVQKKVDGIIFVSTRGSSASIQQLSDLRIPIVIADREIDEIDCMDNLTVVLTDNLHGGSIAVRHLIDLGHRKIGYIGGPSILTPSASRETGYREVMQNEGLPVDERWVARGDFTCESGYAAARQILQSEPAPSAIFCCNDMMAIGAIRAASDLGLSVPQDLSIVGFDDIALAAYLTPALTTVHQPIKEMGDAITQHLFTAFAAKGTNAYQRIVFQPVLTVRQSSGKVKPA